MAGGGEAQTPFQYGTASCIVATGGDNCVATITFNPSFPPGQFINENCGLDSASTSLQLETFLSIDDYFLSVNLPGDGSWVGGMPAAQTELFGTTTNRLNLDTGFLIEIDFQVLVVTPSTSGTAFLDVQYSASQAGPWTSLGFNLPISTAGIQIASIIPPPIGIVNLFQFYRIVGQNGGGITDVPVFTKIFTSFDYLVGRNQILTIHGDNTFFQCAIGTFPPITPSTVVFDWSANLCANGALKC